MTGNLKIYRNKTLNSEANKCAETLDLCAFLACVAHVIQHSSQSTSRAGETFCITFSSITFSFQIAVWVHGLPEAPNLPSITLLVYYHLIYATVPGTKTVSKRKAERGK